VVCAPLLQQMVLNFRVSELQVLLGFAGRNKSGKKQELQARALELLRTHNTPILMKIRELHKWVSFSTSPGASHTWRSTYLKGPAYASLTRAGALLGGAHHGGVHGGDYPSKLHPPPMLPQATGGAQAPPAPSYPVHPDVRFKQLPFFDVLAELHRPASLSECCQLDTSSGEFFWFCLGGKGGVAIANGKRAFLKKGSTIFPWQRRGCKRTRRCRDTSCEQDDIFPHSMCVKVNSKVCPLPNPIPTNKPGVEPKRPSRPINIVSMCRLSPTVSNHVSVTWLSEYGRAYAIGVYLVRKLTASTLLQRLKATGMRNPDHTRAMIKEKLQHDPDSEIATTSLRGSLICPLGKMRMGIPCRALTCLHLQCFDASLYLQMNEKKPTWICPVCDRPATFTSLVIDGLFMEITMKAPGDCKEVQFHEDGSWSPLVAKKETHLINSPTSASTSRATTSTESQPSGRSSKRPRVEVIDLTLDSSDDEGDP
ncbi:sumo ligase, putative, partial [Ixodes scapularis]